MRRIACIALPEIRVEIARERDSQEDGKTGRADSSAAFNFPPSRLPVNPLAVVVARPGGPVKTERDVLGNTRIDVVSREARAAGIRAGQTVAAARAKHAELRVRVVAEDAVR